MRITEPYTIFKRTLSSGRTVYYYQFRDDYGRRSSAYSTGTDNLAQAKRIVRKLYNEGMFKTSSNMTFGAFAKDFFSEGGKYSYLLELKGRKVTKSTMFIYKRALDKLLLPYFEKISINKISTITVREFKKWALEDNAANSVNNAILCLTIILRYAQEKQIIQTLPKMESVKIQKKERSLLTEDELTEFFKLAFTTQNKKASLALLLGACTGMRVGEIMGLKPDCVYENYIDINKSFHPMFGLGDTKTKQNRYVPIPRELSVRLKEIADEEWVFCKDDKPLNKGIIAYCFDKCLEKMDIKKQERGLTVHSLRAFFISYLQSKNISEPKIRAVVGHSDQTMTSVYTYWKPDMFPEINEVQESLYEKIKGVRYER